MDTTKDTGNATQAAWLLYGGMLGGVLLFAAVGPLLLTPQAGNPGGSRDIIVRVLLALSLGGSAISLLLRKRVPRRNTDESSNLFWRSATAPALLTWMPLEAAGLLAIIAYTLTHSLSAIVVGVIAVLLFLVHNPAYLERR